MLEQLIEWDKWLMLAINHANTPFLDIVMQVASYKYSIVPICLLILFLLFYKQNRKRALLYATAIAVTFAICDSGSTILFKHTICRLRPCHDPSIMEMVRMLEYKGGQFGFISSHAANLFGLAVVSSYAVKRRWYGFFIFGWAVLVAYSRVYVGKHFPADVVCGAIFGMLIGTLVLYIVNLVIAKFNLPKNSYR